MLSERSLAEKGLQKESRDHGSEPHAIPCLRKALLGTVAPPLRCVLDSLGPTVFYVVALFSCSTAASLSKHVNAY